MTARTDRDHGISAAERVAGTHRSVGMTFSSPQLERGASEDPQKGSASAGSALNGLQHAYLGGAFALRLDGVRTHSLDLAGLVVSGD